MDHHVLRLDIAMQVTGVMDRLHTRQHLPRQHHKHLFLDNPLVKIHLEIEPPDQLGHQAELPFMPKTVQKTHDMRMLHLPQTFFSVG